ncbi:glycoside hydrolase superfamily [Cryomyces antarcticus]
MVFNKFSSTAVAALALLSPFAEAAPTSFQLQKRALKFNYGGEKVRGVNLGGWFVLEPWITPSIFEAAPGNVVDEYTFCQTLGKSEAHNRLSNHWNTWITEEDFKQIQRAGMNHVRIPIGYWSVSPLDGDPYVQGAYDKLGQALDWAQNANLKVMIDLHGAPGSQNGFDNSGRLGAISWGQGDTVKQTHTALNKIRDDHASHPAVAAIELLNEPMGPVVGTGTVRQFYMDGWGDLENSNVAITIHDAFEGVTSWNDWGSGMWSLLLDTHHYEIFDSGSLQMSPAQHVSTACGFGSQMASNNKWTISGEWTGAQTDCAKWLNGRGKGARYDGTFPGSSYIGSCGGKYTGTVAGLSSDDKRNIQHFIEAQLDAFEKAQGWIFWTWKTEGAPEWDMQALLAGGLFPNPVTNRNLPGQC